MTELDKLKDENFRLKLALEMCKIDRNQAYALGCVENFNWTDQIKKDDKILETILSTKSEK
jgi:hypothetical protein